MEGEATEGVAAGKGEVLAIQRTRGSTGWCPGLRQHVAGYGVLLCLFLVL